MTQTAIELDQARVTMLAVITECDKVKIMTDPTKDAGWLVDTPWVATLAAVFGVTKEDAMAQANASRAAYIAELQAKVVKWQDYELKARFVRAVKDDEFDVP